MGNGPRRSSSSTWLWRAVAVRNTDARAEIRSQGRPIASNRPPIVHACAGNEPDNGHTNTPPTTQIGRLFLLSSGAGRARGDRGGGRQHGARDPHHLGRAWPRPPATSPWSPSGGPDRSTLATWPRPSGSGRSSCRWCRASSAPRVSLIGPDSGRGWRSPAPRSWSSSTRPPWSTRPRPGGRPREPGHHPRRRMADMSEIATPTASAGTPAASFELDAVGLEILSNALRWQAGTISSPPTCPRRSGARST